jgi:integron integrase
MKLCEQMERKIKLQGKSPKTFSTYWQWCESYLKFNREHYGKWVHPSALMRDDIERWLTWLTNERHISKTSQNVALQAVLYLYREVLDIKIDNVNAMRSKRPQQVRDVLDQSEVMALFEQMRGVELLAAQMMYGCGLRIGDLLSLRWKDVSFERKQLTVKDAKGDKWRYTSFPECLHDRMRAQLESVKVLWKRDEVNNPNGVSLPHALRRKSPSYARQLAWFWVFPSDSLSRDQAGVLCRHHRDSSHIARCIKEASERAGIIKRVTSHVLRHSYASHAHESGVSLRTLMELLGHGDIRTTEIYTHADKNAATAAKSPLETLLANPGQRKPAKDDKPFTLRVVG